MKKVLEDALAELETNLPSVEDLMTFLAGVIAVFRKAKNRELRGKQNNSLGEVRDLFLTPEEEDDDEPVARRSGRGRRATGDKKQSEYNLQALEKAGATGLSKMEIAVAVKKLGVVPSGRGAEDISVFANNNYQAGVYPLINEGLVVPFKPEQGKPKRYRLARFAKKK